VSALSAANDGIQMPNTPDRQNAASDVLFISCLHRASDYLTLVSRGALGFDKTDQWFRDDREVMSA
jgi:hypothetical protein